jgi:hypothetical protein
MLPWGDLTESGSFAGIPSGLQPFSQPLVKEAIEQGFNYDIFWSEPIVKDEDLAGKPFLEKAKTQIQERTSHLFQTMQPTLITDIEKGYSAFKSIGDYRGRVRPKSVVAADVFLGMKMYPVDYTESALRYIMKNDPRRGDIAAKIKSDIKSLSIKKDKMEEIGNKRMVKYYQDQIDQKILQITGMAKEAGRIGELLKKAQGEQ